MVNPTTTRGPSLGLKKYLPEYNSEKHLPYLIIGGSVVAGLTAVGVYYYWSRRKRQSKSEKKKGSAGESPSAAAVETPLFRANQLKVQGNDAFKNGDYPGAIKFYTDAISECPKEQSTDLAVFYQNRAAAHEKMASWSEVIEDCSAALQLNNKYIKAIMRRAKAHEQQANLEAALYDYTVGCFLDQFKNQGDLMAADRLLRHLGQKKAAEQFPLKDSDIPLSKTFVESYMTSFCEDPVWQIVNAKSDEPNDLWAPMRSVIASHNYETVADECMNLMNVGGEEEKVLALLLRATFWLLKGKSLKAMDDLTQVFSICDQLQSDIVKKVRTNALIKRASLNLQQGRKDEALNDFNSAQELDPSNADVYQHRAQLKILMDEFEAAKQDFDKAIELRPDFAICNIQRCYAEYRLAIAEHSYMRLEKAMKTFEDVTNQFPDCSEGFAMLGQAMAEQGNFKEAIELFDKALAMNPENVNILVHKGIMELQMSQDKEKAMKIIKKAIEVDPVNDFPYETLAKLESESGNFSEAIGWVEKAIGYSRTELDMANLFTLREAIVAQMKLSQQFGVSVPSMMGT